MLTDIVKNILRYEIKMYVGIAYHGAILTANFVRTTILFVDLMENIERSNNLIDKSLIVGFKPVAF
jgi:hypothetical protein